MLLRIKFDFRSWILTFFEPIPAERTRFASFNAMSEVIQKILQ